ncbi:hypothetical protein [Azospirillum argentinense]|uniref:Uncharacterized protein n=2 Tax=Azospirillum TaxID=191 RepID=A0A5B0L2D0_9PROT|nr:MULTISPECIES: hypothetical protein [Azospirillum]AIB11629.1 hypothetical protein ABAZ39_06315 [Azospirillum argentinense]EZQ08537.1 hypothetical protein ABAZ39_07755 [Azospirillum argentinense]KAA1058962.1 hypothetical protein FH063_001162 [Azospirillum argentinense]MBK3797699.1 hypothetical protein [Azospirillum argentinense]QCN94289.1 hypothetical protein D3093_02860 [Azospirillum argentinense]
MPAPMVADEVRQACRIHARLLDAFITLTEQELAQLAPGFAEESLMESLEKMRAARKSYGALGGVVALDVVASNAA